ncbi:RecQ family ATP-dependent DNA helicase [Planctomycetaceae bacterium SH139]
MPITDAEPSNLLGRFGLQTFRPGQDQVVKSVLSGEDVLCVMPTGGGKSLCYQLPSLALAGTTIVVSPLIALMKDQVDSLAELGIAAALINSSLSMAQQNEAMRRMGNGEFDLVYVAPERLRNGRFLEAVAQANVSLLAVDEAHCISEWGHDFRPDYARLGQFRQRYLGDVQTIALTATATPTVRDDISRLLNLRSPRMYVTGFARDNLRFEVQQCKGDREKDAWLVDYLATQNGAGIIYAATRKRCEELAGWLPEKCRRPIGVYHAGMEPAQRQHVQEQFMAGKLSAIVATNAFGMGIDKSDLRYVVHYNMPGTLEAYYQEAGRAGRDGKPSECALLFSYSDRHIQEFFIENRYPTAVLVRKVYEYLLRRSEDPIELTLAEVRDAVDKNASAEAIGASETLLSKAGVLKRLDSSSNQAVVRIESDLPTLVDLLPREAKVRRRVLRAVEKVVGSHRHEDVYVRPQRLCEMAEVSREQLSRVMRELSGLNAFDYVPPFRGRAVHFLRRDLKFEELEIDFDELETRKQAEYEKLESVIGFARTSRCRQREILDYFGDPSESKCNVCDRCAPINPRLVAAGQISGAEIEANKTDWSADADLCRGIQIVLSGIARTHGRFGKGLVAQMLCGSQNKKMQQWKLSRLSTFGMLSGLRQSQVTDVIDALTEIGLVGQVEVEQRRPTVLLTDQGKEVMMGRQPVPSALKLSFPLAKQLARVAGKLETADVTGRGSGHGSPAGQENSAADQANLANLEPQGDSGDNHNDNEAAGENNTGNSNAGDRAPDSVLGISNNTVDILIGRLKQWRRRVAAASGVPAFRVLTNATLERIAELAPRSVTELEAISGVGPATIEEYGFDLIELVVHSAGDHSPPDQSPQSAQSSPAGSAAGARPERENLAVSELVSEQVPEQVTEQAVEPVASAESGESNTQTAPSAPERDSSYWTWRLLHDGYSIEQVEQIRRIDRYGLLSDLVAQVRGGQALDQNWLREPSPLRPTVQGDGQANRSEELWQELNRLVLVGSRG